MNTCGNCHHYLGYAGQIDGQCYRNPPVPLASGPVIRPNVKANFKACGEHKALAQGELPAVKEKVRPDTVGQAAKAARQGKSNAWQGSGQAPSTATGHTHHD